MDRRLYAVGWRCAVAAAVIAASGCARSVLYREELEETFVSQYDGTSFKNIAVIAGNDSRPDLNMSVGVRTMLVDSGFIAMRAPGRWETEAEAASSICERAFHAVVIVVYDRISVRACPGGKDIAYEIRGGAELGLKGMTQRLMIYLRSGRPPLSKDN